MNKASEKLDKARSNLPTKHRLKSETVFDDSTGKSKKRLFFEKEVKTQAEHLKGPLPLRPVKFGINAAITKAHVKVYQAEDENVGVKAGHRAEMVAEGVVRSGLRYRKTRPYTKAAKAEKRLVKRTARHSRQKLLADNPKLRSNMFSRMMQKRRIKRQAAKQARAGRNTVKAAGTLTKRAATVISTLVKKNPKLWIAALLVAFLFYTFTTCMSLVSNIANSGLGAIFASTYLAEETDIDNAALAYSEWELELQVRVMEVETEFPGYDEYRLDIGTIDHDPLVLMAYLTAVYHSFAYPEIRDALRELFDAQYQLSFTPSLEIRHYMDDAGNIVPYEWHVLTVTLESRPFTSVVNERLSTVQRQHFELLMESGGHRHIVGSPFEQNWHPFISSHYGWRIHPVFGTPGLHRGVDIGFSLGTPILAAHDGVVTFAGDMGGYGNVVFIAGVNGIETRYAHCDTILVSVGQEVFMGDVIATVGNTGVSTGPHLHFEILRNGIYLNPVFFAHSNP